MSEVMGLIFAVLNLRKIKTNLGGLNVTGHNLRQKLSKDSKESIDPSLSHFNWYQGLQNYKDLTQKFNERIENAHLKRKIQRNASRYFEFVFTYGEGFCPNWQNDKKQKDTIDKYFKDCIDFMKQKYGDVILYSSAHFDETTPHLHIMCVPLMFTNEGKDVKFSSSEFLGGRKGLYQLHTDFHEKVGKKYGLARGIQGSRAKHTDIKRYKGEMRKKKLELETKIKEAEAMKKENEYQKSRIQSLQNDIMRRDAEVSKKEKELEDAEKSVNVQVPEIPLPPVQITENARKTWRERVQKMVEKSYMTIAKAFQSLFLKYQRLKEDFSKQTALNENLKKRVEKAERDLAEKPINEIVAERKQKELKGQKTEIPVIKSGQSW